MGEDEHPDDPVDPHGPGDEDESEASSDDQTDVPDPAERAGPDPISVDDETGSEAMDTDDTDSGDEDGEAVLGGRISAAQRQRAERALTWILAIALALSLAGVVYVALVPPQSGSTFSEFYLLGPDGNASEYPTTLAPNQTGTVVVGISNHERKSVEYRMRVSLNGTQTAERTVSVADGDTREFRVNLTAPADPGRYRVRFLLYNETSADPSLRTRLWIQVRNESVVGNETTPGNATAPNGSTDNATTPTDRSDTSPTPSTLTPDGTTGTVTPGDSSGTQTAGPSQAPTATRTATSTPPPVDTSTPDGSASVTTASSG
ncbi:DUF1616 domain-containing protein [Halorientalis pallida]|uniref:DUF1616 domain-containing protein n=1 Tax=Halorientalis pallida TaxID=2479928 RepID=A0A498KYH0_9EURY|nr:DUF1616 domain-containing protein [Halorientalis pallida]RXK46918.1 DUF1616 domain-containing protein [Halorientalis pallida]